MLKVKRIYEAKEADDGVRILVDRLWPRGLRSSEAGIKEWAKEIAPSDELRRWFGHSAERWPEFKQRYLEELSSPEKREQLKTIAQMALRGTVTLGYGARDGKHNNVRVLEELVGQYMTDSTRNY